jgi:2-keto-4-pentenoate hydratase/2-oxohepta-3-ene-1,7-dioic acid hydratase in catechol pathway
VLPEAPKMLNLLRAEGEPTSKTVGLTLSILSRLSAHNGIMQMPRHFRRMKCGVELAVVLAKGGKRIAAEQAASHIAGYSILNGGWVRDPIARQVTNAERNFDDPAPFGP